MLEIFGLLLLPREKETEFDNFTLEIQINRDFRLRGWMGYDDIYGIPINYNHQRDENVILRSAHDRLFSCCFGHLHVVSGHVTTVPLFVGNLAGSKSKP